ncbi:BQ2448_6044 [Microbotryum intermedium]|uniref:Sister chromatid cohesion protein n=1 Tax=Microbotryum intermedium TaxID=269621 RepID=A0A238FP05_9BASI|nr:BQ2448_6044 [Microbotryum intermedium]
MNGFDDAQANIERSARDVIRGYPLAAGLTSVADVINHLPPPRPCTPTLFAHPSSLSLHAGPQEPLFDQYAQEIGTLLNLTPHDEPYIEHWRRMEMARAAEALQLPTQAFAYQGYPQGSVDSFQADDERLWHRLDLTSSVVPCESYRPASVPPYPINPSPTGLVAPPARTLTWQLLDSIGFPYPSLPSTTVPPNFSADRSSTTDADRSQSAAFFKQYLASEAQARRARAPPPPPLSSPSKASTTSMMAQTPPRPGPLNTVFSREGAGYQPPLQLPPTSSPDPLLMSGGPSQSFNGHRYTASPQSSSPSASPVRPGSFTLEIDVDAHRPKRSLPAHRTTESQRAHMLADGDPVQTPHGAGMENAVKRFKLGTSSDIDSGGGGGGASSSSKGTIKAHAAQSIVDRLSDLLTDLFSSDDSYITDTSSSHVQAAAASTIARDHSKVFFNESATTIDGLPLLDGAVLRTLIQQLSNVHAKRAGEELLEDIEEGGVARLLKIVERSWRDVDELKVWPSVVATKEASGGGGGGVARSASKGKMGKFVRRGSSESPQKGRGSRSSSRTVDSEEELEYDFDEEATTRLRSPKSRSRTPTAAMDVDAVESSDAKPAAAKDERVWTDDTLDDFDGTACAITDAVLGIRVALLVLTMTSLPKSLYSVDYLLSILTSLRYAFDTLVFPLVEANADSHLADLIAVRRTEIQALCESLAATTPLVTRLVQQEELSEEIVISSVCFALAPFFHEAAPPLTGKGKKVETNVATLAMKGLRMAALGLTRALYGRYPDQRSWIMEEVLGNLTKLDVAKKGRGAIRLRNGSSIHTLSALILNLVQTCEAGLCAHVLSRIANADQSGLVLPPPVAALSHRCDADDDDNDDELSHHPAYPEDSVAANGGVVDSLTAAHRDLVNPALESATKSAYTVVSYLLTKSSKAGKASSGSIETEYRAVFDNLVADLLVTLHLPEWPAAEVVLHVCCKSMLKSLADTKSTHEGNALKSVALDHLCAIGARLRQDATAKPATSYSSSSSSVVLGNLGDIVGKEDVAALDAYVKAQRDVLRHLVRLDKLDGVAEFAAATLGSDLVTALGKSTSLLAHYTADELECTEAGQLAQAFHARLRHHAEACWILPSDDDVFGPSADDEQPLVDDLAVQLARGRPLAGLYDSILALVVESSESTAVALRTKALRGISLLVAQDPELFHRSEVRASIEHRMHDGSPAVRDATIELVGKYVVTRPDLATRYLPQIAERITDTGLGVRKRVVRLLKTLYGVVDAEEQRIDICRKLVWRTLDEDDGVKELAVDAIEELWFTRWVGGSGGGGGGGADGRGRSGSTGPVGPGEASSMDADDEAAAHEPRINQLANIVMAITGENRDRAPPVDEVLRVILARHKDKATTAAATSATPSPLDRLRDITESLIDGLLEDEGSRNIVACVKTVLVLVSVDASLLSTSKATILLPFLKSATSPQEQIVSDYLLKIFRSAVTTMPKTSTKFAKELQSALMPMLNKPSSSAMTLQEVVACYCAVVRGQTHDFGAMINVFRVSVDRLFATVKMLMAAAAAGGAGPPKGDPTKALPILCFLSSLFCEHANLDQLRTQYPQTKSLINQITPKSISEHVYGILVKLHQLQVSPVVSSAALSSLGFLFRAYPTLMLLPPSTSIMDAVFDSPAQQTQLQLLKIMQDFLGSQARAGPTPLLVGESKKAAAAAARAHGGVKIEELVGNVDGFADSGVASAISQRYIDQILVSTLSTNPAIQRVGVDLLTSVARSGFSHPLTITPHLVALATSPDAQISSQAYATLSLLYQKHASLLSTRFVEPAKVAFMFSRSSARAQQQAPRQRVSGYRGDPPVSHFGRWYSLLQKEKRVVQLDFLKTLTRALEVEPGASCGDDDVALVLYIAEALSTLDYKRCEEPMSVIAHLNAALAVSGLQVLHLLEADLEQGSGLLGEAPAAGEEGHQSPTDTNTNEDRVARAPRPDLARQSVMCGIALLLRDHLKMLYSITDAKLSKFAPGKKSAQGDRPVVRRAEAPLALGTDDYARMPFALVPMSTPADLIQQRHEVRSRAYFPFETRKLMPFHALCWQYIHMIQEDGTINALDESEMEGEEMNV